MSIITFSDKLSKFLMVVAAAWAFGLSFLVLAAIIGRGAFDTPIHGTAEIVAASIVIIVWFLVILTKPRHQKLFQLIPLL